MPRRAAAKPHKSQWKLLEAAGDDVVAGVLWATRPLAPVAVLVDDERMNHLRYQGRRPTVELVDGMRCSSRMNGIPRWVRH